MVMQGEFIHVHHRNIYIYTNSTLIYRNIRRLLQLEN